MRKGLHPTPRMKYRLTDLERRFLVAASHAADASNRSIATALDLQEHKVRYIREKLLREGIIKPSFLFDPARIGLTAFGIYFSRGGVSTSNRLTFENAVRESPSVFWFSEMSGAYQYGATYLVDKPYELERFFEHIRSGGAGIRVEKRIAIRTSWTRFSRNYLFPAVSKRFSDTMVADVTPHELEPIDRKILARLSASPESSLSQTARALSIQPSTLSYRIEQLRKRAILLPSTYSLHRSAVGIVVYRALIVECGFSPAMKQRFLTLCARDPHVVSLIQCTGDWDYELRIEAENPEDVHIFIQTILDTFGPSIASIITVQELTSVRSTPFPKRGD